MLASISRATFLILFSAMKLLQSSSHILKDSMLHFLLPWTLMSNLVKQEWERLACLRSLGEHAGSVSLRKAISLASILASNYCEKPCMFQIDQSFSSQSALRQMGKVYWWYHNQHLKWYKKQSRTNSKFIRWDLITNSKTLRLITQLTLVDGGTRWIFWPSSSTRCRYNTISTCRMSGSQNLMI